MSRFTPAEIALLQGLVNCHIVALGNAMQHAVLTAAGAERYQREVRYAELLREKLGEELEYVLALPDLCDAAAGLGASTEVR